MRIRFVMRRDVSVSFIGNLVEAVGFDSGSTIKNGKVYSPSKEIKSDAVYKFDQFFTKKEVAIECLNAVAFEYDFAAFDLVVEPSAGTGSFLYNLPENKRIGIEIDDDLCRANPRYLHKSFFDFEPDKGENILVVGNPPFGTQNKLSVEFFNHAAKFASVIAFIIPKTWNKHSIHNRLDKRFHLVKTIDLPLDPFEGNKPTTVKCCFQIWEKRDILRKKEKRPLLHKDWDFLRYIEKDGDLFPPQADFVVLAYGSNSGRLSQDLYKWRPKSVHFIKANIDLKELMKRFKSLDYSCANDSARQSSLCKADLVELYTESFGK